ncbi:MAG: metal ABC transporter ATP-binding protein [Saprospiraceae bacterium]|nr:metal ABC transporter ATP-binding protein [Saprospiraceae bacterium]
MHNLPTIEISGLTVAYGNKRVLSNIYLKIEPGHIYGLIGPNGAGKSTLFKCLLGQIEPNAGNIRILNNDLHASITGIAYVPQKDHVDWQFPATVEDVVLMGRYAHLKWYQKLTSKDYQLAESAMNELNILAFRNRQIGELSGGQQQRCFLARALCQDAEIYLMDEPFVGVDVKTESKIIQILKSLASKGKTILVVHHDLDSVQNYFDKVILINQRLVAHGSTADAFTKENISATYASQSHLIQKNF